MYIKVNINYSIDSNIKFKISGSESLCINIENDIVGKLTVGVIYRHPVYHKDSIGKFIESIENLHRKIISQKRYFFVMGDINPYYPTLKFLGLLWCIKKIFGCDEQIHTSNFSKKNFFNYL